jgi:thioredoxin:protein disulfide reductase
MTSRASRTRSWLLVIASAIAWAARAQAQTPPTPDLVPIAAADGAHAGSSVRVALQVRLPEGAHVNSNKPRDPALKPTALSLDAPSGIDVVEVVFPQPQDLKQNGADQPLSVFEREFTIGVELRLPKSLATGAIMIPATFSYQACNETMCFAPKNARTGWTLTIVPSATRVAPLHREVFDRIAFGHGESPSVGDGAAASARAPAAVPPPTRRASLDDFVVQGTAGGALGTRDFLQFIHNAEAGIKEKGLFEGRGALAILFIVFVGGLALNLTPCVLPMIPINLAIIGAGAQAGSRGRGFLLGATYGSAMAVVYGVLGVVVILTAGTFGSINSDPWFNAGIAVLFVVLALAMFDVVVIDFSRFSSSVNVGGAGSGTFLVAFAMGAVAALLAGACVAPVVIQVVLFSSNLYATGTAAALALPFVLGLGMAVPWPIAGAGIAALPRPGAWMVRIKQAFGVFILGTAVYYGYEAYGIFANRRVDPAAVSAGVEEQLKAGWHASMDEGLALARLERKPVLIDMWATWCKNCLVMDATTLKDQDVTTALSNYVKIKFQAESPDESPAKEVMARFGAVGLPTYVILRLK